MTIEIRELVIRASVPAESAMRNMDELLERLRREVLEQCLDALRERLERDAER
jgi:hypothetical protein